MDEVESRSPTALQTIEFTSPVSTIKVDTTDKSARAGIGRSHLEPADFRNGNGTALSDVAQQRPGFRSRKNPYLIQWSIRMGQSAPRRPSPTVPVGVDVLASWSVRQCHLPWSSV
jgi:hypothetical protein